MEKHDKKVAQHKHAKKAKHKAVKAEKAAQPDAPVKQ